MSTMRAWACGERSTAECSRRGSSVQEVVDVAALAAQEALVLHARHLGAEHLRGHASPRSRSATISLARSTDFTMFW